MTRLYTKHKEEISILACRLALHFQKEIALFFFDESDIDDTPYQGMSIKRYNIDRETGERMVKDLEFIHVNRDYNGETVFIICNSIEDLQTYYDERRNGKISTKVCRHFNFFEDKNISDQEITDYRELMELEVPRIMT